MLLYCKFICSLSVERQIKALHQNQSEKHRNTHRRPLNSKYQSILLTFFVQLASPLKHCRLSLPEKAAWCAAAAESRTAAESPSLTAGTGPCAVCRPPACWSHWVGSSGSKALELGLGLGNLLLCLRIGLMMSFYCIGYFAMTREQWPVGI